MPSETVEQALIKALTYIIEKAIASGVSPFLVERAFCELYTEAFYAAYPDGDMWIDQIRDNLSK